MQAGCLFLTDSGYALPTIEEPQLFNLRELCNIFNLKARNSLVVENHLYC